MEIKINIDLDDLLEPVSSVYDDEGYNYGETLYTIKNKEQLCNDVYDMIKETVIESVFNNVYNKYGMDLVTKLINENKDAIINGVIKEVSKKIFNSKAIKDFKKTLD